MASKKYFGTDGIRNTANRGPLTPGFILRLGRVIGRALRDDPSFFEPAFFEPAAEVPAGGGKPIAVVARDSRISGDMIESALVAGLLAEGIDVKRAGILSTPALARVAYRAAGAAAGFMISASHNPYPDNGIKVFGPGGFKISEQTELLIESAVDAEPADAETGPTGGAIGTAADARELRREYEDYILGRFEGLDLAPVSIVLDCANGALSDIAPDLLRSLGALPRVIHADPAGTNINIDCGALYPETVAMETAACGAAIGIAFDGDADRVLLADEKGQIVDGDEILYVSAAYLAGRGKLPHATVVATIMSNMGLEAALGELGVSLKRTDVGDRYVVEEMLKGGYTLGGEQSGHVVFLDYATTGDGLLTALCILKMMADTGKKLSELTEGMTKYPHMMESIPVRERIPFESIPGLTRAVEAAEEELGADGRLNLRYSGTEKKARVMVEAKDAETAARIIERVSHLVKLHLS